MEKKNINSQTFISENNTNKFILIIHNSNRQRIPQFIKYFPKINSHKEIEEQNELKFYLLESK